jgi:hypothetical protein
VWPSMHGSLEAGSPSHGASAAGPGPHAATVPAQAVIAGQAGAIMSNRCERDRARPALDMLLNYWGAFQHRSAPVEQKVMSPVCRPGPWCYISCLVGLDQCVRPFRTFPCFALVSPTLLLCDTHPPLLQVFNRGPINRAYQRLQQPPGLINPLLH